MLPNNEEQTPRTFVFREPRNSGELLALLRLRYQVYRESRVRGACPANSVGIDIDCWDNKAVHFGLFQQSGESDYPVGYQRIVSNDTSPQLAMLHALAVSSPSVRIALDQLPPCNLPLLEYSDTEGLVREFIRVTTAGRTIPVEPGRLSLLPDIRGLRFARHMAEAALAYGFGGRRCRAAILNCHVTHAPFYKQYGFKGVPGAEDRYQRKLDGNYSVLYAESDDLPHHIRPRITSLWQELESSGTATLNFSATGRTTGSLMPAVAAISAA